MMNKGGVRVSLMIALSSTSIITCLLFKNKKYTIPCNKIAVSIIILELFATIAAAFVSLYLEMPLNFFFTPGTHLYVLVENIFTVGLIEEFAKFIVIYITTSRLTKLRRYEDLMLYFILSACTFAALENSLYMFVYDMDVNLAFMRSFISAPCHIIYSAIFAFFYTSYLEILPRKKFILVQGLFFSSLFHGFMNFCLGYYDYTLNILGALTAFFMLCAYYAIGLVLIKNHFHKIHCAYCLSSIIPESNFCIYCGTKIDHPTFLKDGKRVIYATSLLIGLLMCILSFF